MLLHFESSPRIRTRGYQSKLRTRKTQTEKQQQRRIQSEEHTSKLDILRAHQSQATSR